jgi:uncharacterized protein YqgV (UPF0045/DUF77 family)
LQTIRNSLLDLDANLIPSEKITRILNGIQQMGLEYDENTYFKDLELTLQQILWIIKSLKVTKYVFLNGIQKQNLKTILDL